MNKGRAVNTAWRSIAGLFACAVFLCGCEMFKGVGINLGVGLSESSKAIADSAMAGVQQRMADPTFKKDLAHTLDSLMDAMGISANEQVRALKDSLLDDKWKDFTTGLVESATGEHTRKNLGALRDELAGERTREQVRALLGAILNDSTKSKLADMRNEILGENTRAKAGLLRDELLGQKTKEAIAAIVDSAAVRFSLRLSSAVDDNASVIKKYANEWLLLLGGIAMAVIALVWRNRQKYLKLTKLLTTEVSDIPDRKAYDELTRRIQTKARDSGQEPALQVILKENGLLDAKAWKDRQDKISFNTN